MVMMMMVKKQKKYIIKDGLLKTPLGGSVAQQRVGIDGVANSRQSVGIDPQLIEWQT